MIIGKETERYAVAYADGSFGVCSESADVQQTAKDAEFSDEGETDPAQFSKVVRVKVVVLEVIK